MINFHITSLTGTKLARYCVSKCD